LCCRHPSKITNFEQFKLLGNNSYSARLKARDTDDVHVPRANRSKFNTQISLQRNGGRLRVCMEDKQFKNGTSLVEKNATSKQNDT